jgi:small subunit ribosomal protein S3
VGQKVHPKGFRLGIYLDWDARWFARGPVTLYGKQLLEDFKIRNYLNKVLARAEVAKLEIEKAGDSVRVIIHSGRPGVVIGKKGQEIDTIRKDLAKLINKNSIEMNDEVVIKKLCVEQHFQL